MSTDGYVYCVLWVNNKINAEEKIDFFRVTSSCVDSRYVLDYIDIGGNEQWHNQDFWPRSGYITCYSKITAARCFPGMCFRTSGKEEPFYKTYGNLFWSQITRKDQVKVLSAEELKSTIDQYEVRFYDWESETPQIDRESKIDTFLAPTENVVDVGKIDVNNVLEKDMENLIARYPEEFFPGEGLELVGQQVRLKQKIADIIFKDRFDRRILVEVKRGVLDRKAAGQLTEYYGLIRSMGDNRPMELVLYANVVPAERRKFLELCGIDCKEIPENRLFAIAKRYGYSFVGG